MRKILLIIFIMFGFFSKTLANYETLAYNYTFKNLNGETINLADYKNKLIIVVNVASRCGFTSQYEELQKLWDQYKDKNLVVLGIPTNNFKQEPGSNKEIKDFCESNFGISFPMSEKVDVIGKDAHPFYKWAYKNHGKNAIPKWNFHKIIINKNGKVANTFSSLTKPYSKKFITYIETEIKN